MKAKKILKVFFELLIIVLVFVGTVFVDRTRSSGQLNLNEYADSYVVYSDGSSARFDSKDFGIVNKGDNVSIRVKLPEKILVEDGVLAFSTYNSITEVRYNGALLDSYGREIAKNGNLVGLKKFLVNIPNKAWGGDIIITLKITENYALNGLDDLCLFESENAYRYYIDSDYVGFVVSLPMFFCGFCALFLFILNGKFFGQSKKVAYISLFAIIASVWIMTHNSSQNIFGWDNYVWSQLEYISIFIMVVPLLLYAYETEGKTKLGNVIGATIAANVGFFIACSVANYTNLSHFAGTIYPANVVNVISGVILLVFVLKREVKGSKSDRVFCSGMIVLFFAGMTDLIIANVHRYYSPEFLKEVPSMLPAGVIICIFYLIRSYIMEYMDRKKELITSEVKSQELQHLIASIPAGVGVVSLDDDLTVLQSNDELYGILGITKEQITDFGNDSASRYVTDEGREIIRKRIIEDRKTGVNKGEIELPIVTFDGRQLFLLVKYNYEGRELNQVIINAIDITVRKNMEEEIALSEKRYKLALSQSGKVFFFFDIPTRTMRISKELSELFGLPMEVDNMPENSNALRLVEKESIDVYKNFYYRIISGEESGDAIISCHILGYEDKVLWYRIAFTSIFDIKHRPTSAIITYEDINDQHESELSAKWKQINLISVPEEKYVIAVYDITSNHIISQVGKMFTIMPEFIYKYDEINAFVMEHFVFEDDREACAKFLDADRITTMFRNGKTSDYIEYRSLQSASVFRWTSMALQMIEDQYNGHLMLQILFMDIHTEKSGEMQMKHTMDELRKELDNSRIKIMINQMQPHFLYNALSAIQTIVKSDPDYAYKLIYDFTVHLRSSIKALSSDEPIPFRDELKNIKAYLNIEKMRFGDSLNVIYDIGCDDFKVIPLSIQPLAENAARHGVYPYGDKGGTVIIKTYEEEKNYVVEVEDNGTGFDVDEVLNRKSDSVGLKNLIFRLKSLMNAEINIKSVIGSGTKITVLIPKEGQNSQ